jgi:regulator of protease activity HflC (stomatin/prohibitin superfamily)
MGVIQALLGILVLIVAATVLSTIHEVPEGHVGVYWRGGALIPGITEPGYHFKVPFLDKYEAVQISVQTDKVTDIPCGTSGGVLVWFERVEVVNRLKKEYVWDTVKNYTTNYDRLWLYDKVHHELNSLCSLHTLQEIYIDLFGTVDDILAEALQDGCTKYAPGIEVLSIRVTKPKLPATIMKNYELMEAEKTKLMIAAQAQKVSEKEAETQRLLANIEAKKVAEVAAIRAEQEVAQAEAAKRISQIEDETHLNRERALADAEFYKVVKAAEGAQQQLTPEYLQLAWSHAIANNTKIYFGPSVNNMLLDFMASLDTFQKKPAK